MNSKRHYYFLSSLLFLIFLTSCDTIDPSKTLLQKSYEQRTLPKEVFSIDTHSDQVLESEDGVVLSIPKGVFLDEEGNVFEGTANIDLVAIQDPASMILAHLPSTSAEGLLKTYGVVQLTASAEGKPLSIHPDQSIYIELPVDVSGKNLVVYEGIKDKNGAITWKNPSAIPKFLIAQEIESLDFYPEGFERTVEANFLNSTRQVKDSLYYLMYNDWLKTSEKVEAKDGESDGDDGFYCDGVSPLIIKSIKDKKFANTFLATREFSERLKVLFRICDDANLELYINNLDKNLWEVDELVAKRLGKGHAEYTAFMRFAAEKLTTVKGGEKHAKQLKAFYAKQLKRNEAEAEKKAKAYQALLDKQSKAAEKLRAEYKKLLHKRMNYRLKKHGIVIKKSSPYTLVEVLEKLERFELTVEVPNAKEFERTHVYIVDPVELCLFAMLPNENGIYDHGYDDDWPLVMWPSQQTFAVAVAYRNDSVFMGATSFKLKKKNAVAVTPEYKDEEAAKVFLKQFDRKRKSFNHIAVDLKYHKAFEKEKARNERMMNKWWFYFSLRTKVYPQCVKQNYLANSTPRLLFEQNCASCHGIHEKKKGPALAHILEKYSASYLFEYTLNTKHVGIANEKAVTYKEGGNTIVLPTNGYLEMRNIFDILTYIELTSDQK